MRGASGHSSAVQSTPTQCPVSVISMSLLASVSAVCMVFNGYSVFVSAASMFSVVSSLRALWSLYAVTASLGP